MSKLLQKRPANKQLTPADILIESDPKLKELMDQYILEDSGSDLERVPDPDTTEQRR